MLKQELISNLQNYPLIIGIQVLSQFNLGEHGGVVVEHQTLNREVLGLTLTGGMVLCP